MILVFHTLQLFSGTAIQTFIQSNESSLRQSFPFFLVLTQATVVTKPIVDLICLFCVVLLMKQLRE